MPWRDPLKVGFDVTKTNLYKQHYIFHCFVQCLIDLFLVLSCIWESFGEYFTKQCFIFRFSYDKRKKKKRTTDEFFQGQSNLAIYLSRKY